MNDYHKLYYRKYKQRKRRGNLVLSLEEYSLLKKLAVQNKRSLPNQIKQMVFAYHHCRYLVPTDITARLDQINFILRNVGNNVNQIAAKMNTDALYSEIPSNRILQVLDGIFDGLSRLEKQVQDYIQEPPCRDY